MKTPLILSGSLALSCFALLGPLEGSAAQQQALTLTQQANQALGLSHSILSEVRVMSASSEHMRVGVDLPGSPIVLDLVPHSVRAENFEARAQLDDGSWVVLPEEPVRTYRGTIASDPGSVVAASMLDDGLHARLRLSDGEEFWVEPLGARVPQARAGEHVVYATESVNDIGATCAASQLEALDPPGMRDRDASRQSNGGTYAASVTAELGCDADYEYFQAHGAGTGDRIESIINTMNLQYSSDVEITHSITTILIRTSSNDPYSRKRASQLLNEFRNEWNNNQSAIERDVAHLFTGKDLSGSTIGVAYISQVCNIPLAYGLVESDFSGNFACATDLSAHELGHNWGADHCSCSGFTMNASITCANQFSPSATIPDILAYKNAQSCFGAGPTTGSVAGTVTSSAGPISGATVQVDTGQSDTTDGLGDYTITGVTTGSRSVTASAPGFDALTDPNVDVTEGQTTSGVDFVLASAPVGSQAIVDCITYRSTGGQNSDRNLFIDVTIVDDAGAPVSGASVAVSVTLGGAPFGTASATTDSSGEVTFQAKNSPNGCFVTEVTSVSAAGLSFDGTEPLNGFNKGVDSSPDPDCRSGWTPCGP